MTKRQHCMIHQMTVTATATVGLGNSVVSSSLIKLSTKLEHISYANWQCFLDLPYPPCTILHGTSTVRHDIGLESTLFDGMVAEQPRAVHAVSVRLR